MGILVDDVGSFPLPNWISKEAFERTYVKARKIPKESRGMDHDKSLLDDFRRVVIGSFRRKIATGLDVVNYPQHYDMYRQMGDLISGSMDKGSYAINRNDAVLPELKIISEEAKLLHEELGKEIALRVCILGPMEQYLRIVGTACYKDILLMISETVRRFAENSVLHSKHIRTEVVSLDEPSFGLQEISTGKDTIKEALHKAFSFPCSTKQIHLHSTSGVSDLLEVGNIDVLSFEFAASPANIEGVSRKMLEDADKYVRVGITRTDLDAIRAELLDKGFTKPKPDQMVEDERTISRRFASAKGKYGDRMSFAGPDCGLGGWPTQESAQLLLKRTVDAVKKCELL